MRLLLPDTGCPISDFWSLALFLIHQHYLPSETPPSLDCAEGLSLLWSKLACCSLVVAAFATGLNSTAIVINNNLLTASRVPVICALLIHSPASAHAHPASHTHIRVVLIPYPFSYGSQFCIR